MWPNLSAEDINQTQEPDPITDCGNCGKLAARSKSDPAQRSKLKSKSLGFLEHVS